MGKSPGRYWGEGGRTGPVGDREGREETRDARFGT